VGGDERSAGGGWTGVTANEQRRRAERIGIRGVGFCCSPPHVQKQESISPTRGEKRAPFFTFGTAPGNPVWSRAEGALPNRATVLKTRFVVEIL
jgi:hypothetical protein